MGLRTLVVTGKDGRGPASQPPPHGITTPAFPPPVWPCAWVNGDGSSVGCRGAFTRGAGRPEQAYGSQRDRCVVHALRCLSCQTAVRRGPLFLPGLLKCCL